MAVFFKALTPKLVSGTSGLGRIGISFGFSGILCLSCSLDSLMRLTRLFPLVSSFGLETLPYLLAFGLLHSLNDIIDPAFPFTFVISPAQAVPTIETFNNW